MKHKNIALPQAVMFWLLVNKVSLNEEQLESLSELLNAYQNQSEDFAKRLNNISSSLKTLEKTVESLSKNCEPSPSNFFWKSSITEPSSED